MLDGENPANSTAQVSIDAASVDTGNTDRDAHVRNADFLDVEKFPTLSFVSREVAGRRRRLRARRRPHRQGRHPARDHRGGDRGHRRPVRQHRAGFSGEATINRKDFGLTWNVALEAGGILVSDKVKITLDVSAVKQA